MNLVQLTKAVQQKDALACIYSDDLLHCRIFIYTPGTVRGIINFIDKIKEYKIEGISHYPPNKKQYPICVLRVRRLRIKPKRTKTKRRAKTATPNANIDNQKAIVKQSCNGNE